MRIGIFGGTFNPVHMGHLELANEFVSLAKLDELLLIPTKIPPHKSNDGVAQEHHRMNMCSLAAKYIDRVTVSDIELKREGRSYTVETLRELRGIYPEGEFYLVVGADMFVCFDEWREWRTILHECVICTAARNGDSVKVIEETAKKFGITDEKLVVTTRKIMTVSSTEIREKIKCGESVKGLVPDEVIQYIEENNLYR